MVREKLRPDGTVSERTTRVEAEASGSERTENASATGTAETRTETRTVIVRERADWRVTASAGWRDLGSLEPSLYRLEVTRRIVGGTWIGAWAQADPKFTTPAGGVSVALEW